MSDKSRELYAAFEKAQDEAFESFVNEVRGVPDQTLVMKALADLLCRGDNRWSRALGEEAARRSTSEEESRLQEKYQAAYNAWADYEGEPPPPTSEPTPPKPIPPKPWWQKLMFWRP